jgi:hypothetical protein
VDPDLQKILKALQENEKRLDEEMRHLKERTRMSQPLQNIPPPVILRCRELQKQGHFKRRIVKRTPRDIEIDLAELECGHSWRMFGWSDNELVECPECRNEWLKSNAGSGSLGEPGEEK